MSDHTQWQRQTALNKYRRDRELAEQTGAPVHHEALVRNAAAYVGATPDKVRDWVRGL